MRYDENIRILSAYYCYETDEGTILMIANPECEEEGEGYVVAEYGLDHWSEIVCHSVMYDIENWTQIEKEHNITKFAGIATSELTVLEYLLERYEDDEESEIA